MAAASAGTGLSWTSPVLDQLKQEGSRVVVTTEEATWIASILGKRVNSLFVLMKQQVTRAIFIYIFSNWSDRWSCAIWNCG